MRLFHTASREPWGPRGLHVPTRWPSPVGPRRVQRPGGARTAAPGGEFAVGLAQADAESDFFDALSMTELLQLLRAASFFDTPRPLPRCARRVPRQLEPEPHGAGRAKREGGCLRGKEHAPQNGVVTLLRPGRCWVRVRVRVSVRALAAAGRNRRT